MCRIRTKGQLSVFEENYYRLSLEMYQDLPEVKPNSILTLFHYTKEETSKQIVRNDSIVLRFTEGKCFSDKNEGILIFEPYRFICNKLWNYGKFNKAFYDLLCGITNEDIRSLSEQRWIFCFSNNGNSKYLKERYAPRDGKIIGIHFLDLHGIFYRL